MSVQHYGYVAKNNVLEMEENPLGTNAGNSYKYIKLHDIKE